MKGRTISDYVRLGILLVCLIGICVLAFLMYQDFSKFQSQTEANAEQIAQLQKELDDIQVTTTTAEESKVALNSARTLGARIAELQNQYMARMKEQAENPGDEIAYYEALNTISAELDTYFGENSTFRGGWYLGDPGESEAVWSFCTNYSFTGDSLPVLWKCTGEGGLLAYVTGQYHVDTNTIDGLQSYVTLNGTSYYPTTQSDTAVETEDNFDAEAYADSILEMVGNIKAAGDVTVPERTEQEQSEYEQTISEIKEAQAGLKDRLTGGDDE